VKVVIIPASAEAVGVAVHAVNLARLLSAHGMLDVVCVPGRGWITERLDAEGLPWAVVPFSPCPASFLASSARLLRFLRGRAPDVVHLHGRLPVLLCLLSMAVLRRRSRFVATVHEFSGVRPDGLFGVKRRLETWALRRLARVSCVSRALRDEVIERMGEGFRGRVEHIPNWIERRRDARAGIDRPRPRGVTAEVGRTVRLCAVGRLSPEKGFDVLVDAVALLARDGYGITCDIYGAGPEREALRERIGRRGLSGRVALRGAVSNARERLSGYDAVVIPSRSEAFGLVALEAYDAGVPVVASDLPGLREVVLHDRTGLLFGAGDPTDLAAAVARLAASPALADALARGGLALLADHGPSVGLADRYRDFYG
jgi:glycosyltransferase involved in cell wall biosynthesis